MVVPNVVLIAVLGLAEASLKTPRTVISSSPSLSSATSTLEAVIPPTTTTTTTANESLYIIWLNGSSSALRPKTTIIVETRSAALPIDVATAELTGVVSNTPKITPSPELDPPGANFHEIGVKFVQTTYWSCATFSLETHCGWHEPVLDAGACGMRREGSGRVALRAGVVAGVVAGGLALGM